VEYWNNGFRRNGEMGDWSLIFLLLPTFQTAPLQRYCKNSDTLIIPSLFTVMKEGIF
jgi:hypothetical protein